MLTRHLSRCQPWCQGTPQGRQGTLYHSGSEDEERHEGTEEGGQEAEAVDGRSPDPYMFLFVYDPEALSSSCLHECKSDVKRKGGLVGGRGKQAYINYTKRIQFHLAVFANSKNLSRFQRYQMNAINMSLGDTGSVFAAGKLRSPAYRREW